LNYADKTTSTSLARTRPRARTVIPQKSAGSQGLAFRLQQLLTEHRTRLPEACFLLVVLASLLLVAFTFRDYGFTHDEIFGYRRAENIYKFLVSFGEDRAGVSEFRFVSFYGAMPDVLGMFLQNMFPSLGLDARHLVSGLFGVVGIYYTGRLAGQIAGPWSGAIAALFLLLCTFWTGYSFINLKDIPFAASLLGALSATIFILDGSNQRLWPSYVLLAFWAGALATCKLTGILFLGFFVVFLFCFFLLESKQPPIATLARRVLVASLSGIAGILAFSLVFWPQIYIFSVPQLFEVVLAFVDFPGWHNQVLLAGRYYNYDEIPRSYLLTYLVIGIPTALWALYLAGLALTVLNRDWRMLGIALLAPLMLAIQAVTNSLVYTGARHMLFVVPFLMIAAAYGATRLARINVFGRASWRSTP
jgi:hypothetical protein